MDEKFIYVFDAESKKKLLEAGFKLIASYEKKNVYVFLNSNSLSFALNDISCCLSNKLTF